VWSNDQDSDYTERLDRLRRLGRDDEAEGEFDCICEALFNATIDDISERDLARIFDFDGDLRKKLSVSYCRSLGYDLIIRDRVTVIDWEDFAAMIVAQDEGLLPKTAEERASHRLEAEAAEFLTAERTNTWMMGDQYRVVSFEGTFPFKAQDRNVTRRAK
jgi:hypothetical protein